jgi:hypothetical protein
MAKITYRAIVEITVKPGCCSSQSDASDWFWGLLSENQEILNWEYLKVANIYLSPREVLVDGP